MSHACVLVAIPGDVAEEGIESAVSQEMEPFDEAGKWFADGSRWDWWMIGGRYSRLLPNGRWIRRRDLNKEEIEALRAKKAEEWWSKAEGLDEDRRYWEYGIESGQSREEYVALYKPFRAYAFLKEHEWNEMGRLGWFGCQAKNECNDDVESCRYVKDDMVAAVNSHNKSEEEWASTFWTTFIEDLPKDTWLVVVDYHV